MPTSNRLDKAANAVGVRMPGLGNRASRGLSDSQLARFAASYGAVRSSVARPPVLPGLEGSDKPSDGSGYSEEPPLMFVEAWNQ